MRDLRKSERGVISKIGQAQSLLFPETISTKLPRPRLYICLPFRVRVDFPRGYLGGEPVTTNSRQVTSLPDNRRADKTLRKRTVVG